MQGVRLWCRMTLAQELLLIHPRGVSEDRGNSELLIEIRHTRTWGQYLEGVRQGRVTVRGRLKGAGLNSTLSV